MSLNAAIEAALPELRAEAEGRMTVTAKVEAVAVTPGPTGADVETPTVIHQAIRCRIQAGGRRQSVLVHVAGSIQAQVSDEVHFPWDTIGLEAGLRVTITAIGPLDPPSLLGNVYRLSSPHEGSQAKAQRWGVETWAALMS